VIFLIRFLTFLPSAELLSMVTMILVIRLCFPRSVFRSFQLFARSSFPHFRVTTHGFKINSFTAGVYTVILTILRSLYSFNQRTVRLLKPFVGLLSLNFTTVLHRYELICFQNSVTLWDQTFKFP